MVTDRSTCGDNVSTSVAELLPTLVSVVAGGAATVAVFDKAPMAAAATSAVTVKVAVPPTARLTVVLMSPAPPAAQVPLTATQLQTAFDKVAANVSTTEAPTTFDGPLLLTTMMYVTGVPGTSEGDPSVFVIDRSD